MIKRLLLLGFILIASCEKKSTSVVNTLNLYFNHVKALDFEKSEEVLKIIDDSTLSGELKQLNRLLKNGVKGSKINIDNKVVDFESNSILSCINLLKRGYYELYFNPEKTLAFESFYDALGLSREIGSEPLRKFCLKSLLEYYKTEIARNDKNYQTYLDELKLLNSDELDYVWEVLYELFFKTAYVKELDKDYYSLLGELNVFESSLPANHPILSQIYFEKALGNEMSGNWIEANKFYKKALRSSSQLKNQSYISFSSTIKIAEYLKRKGQIDSAFQKLKEIKPFMNPNDTLKDQYYLSHYKSTFFKEIDKCCDAYDELLKSTDVGFLLDFRTNNLEIARLNVELETKDKEILNNRLKNQLIGLILLALIAILIALIIFQNTTKKRKLAEKEALLKQQKVDNLLKEQELVSIDAMIAGQEKERQKVAGELHDDLGSLMATIKLHFDNSKMSKKDPALQNAQKLLDEAYQKVRSMAHNKNSGVMSDQGLLSAIKKMAKTITKTDALKVTVEDFGLGERLENSLELSIFRMVQELVANAIKHAEATKVNIQLTQYEDNLNIIVEDDGKGFDRSKLDKSRSGMGLTNIEKRVEHLEGSFTVDSVLGKGTSILIDIPV